MAQVSEGTRFAEIERLLGDYFTCHILPVMRSAQEDMKRQQEEETKACFRGKGDTLGSRMSYANACAGNPYNALYLTGAWTNKTAEDYIAVCGEKISSSKDISQDLATIADEWRTAVIGEIGRERYDELSEQLGEDLAYAYVDHRIEELMVDKMVQDDMPKSTAEYIMRKAAESSLLGLPSVLNKSPLQTEINERSEKAFNPSKTDKVTGWVAGSVADSVALCGGSWVQLAKFVGIDLVLNSGVEIYKDNHSAKGKSVEECISKGVWGSDTNVFTGFRNEAKSIDKEQDGYIKETNSRLNKKIPVESLKLVSYEAPSWEPYFKLASEEEPDYTDVPMIIAPDQVENYRADREREAAKEAAKEAEKPVEASSMEVQSVQAYADNSTKQVEAQQTTQSTTTNESGWGGFLSNFGLDGIGDIGKNLGYVIAMLPDILLGLFTGKTKSLNMKNSLLPLVSIVAGIFVKNPILKMLLIGMGGANLLNKVGHEALEKQMPSNTTQNISQSRYKRYDDEPLNPRISNPVLQGNSLVADIDKVPYTIQLSPTVVDAYRSGALPLNTLANAVLERSDAMREAVARNYEENERQTVVRTRGIQ